MTDKANTCETKNYQSLNKVLRLYLERLSKKTKKENLRDKNEIGIRVFDEWRV